MKHTVLAVVALMLLVTAASVSAHHGCAAFATEHRITIEGELQEIQLANPHVVMRIRTADSTMPLPAIRMDTRASTAYVWARFRRAPVQPRMCAMTVIEPLEIEELPLQITGRPEEGAV